MEFPQAVEAPCSIPGVLINFVCFVFFVVQSCSVSPHSLPADLRSGEVRQAVCTAIRQLHFRLKRMSRYVMKMQVVFPSSEQLAGRNPPVTEG
jgi:hypothetical protein